MKKVLGCLLILCGTIHISFAQKSMTAGIWGKWLFLSASENELGKIADNQLPDLIFPDSAFTVSGSIGCNKMNGSYEIEGEQFIFGPMVSTYKACPDMSIENFLNRFLPRVGYYRIENDRLYLYDKDDRTRYIIYRRNTAGHTT